MKGHHRKVLALGAFVTLVATACAAPVDPVQSAPADSTAQGDGWCTADWAANIFNFCAGFQTTLNCDQLNCLYRFGRGPACLGGGTQEVVCCFPSGLLMPIDECVAPQQPPPSPLQQWCDQYDGGDLDVKLCCLAKQGDPTQPWDACVPAPPKPQPPPPPQN